MQDALQWHKLRLTGCPTILQWSECKNEVDCIVIGQVGHSFNECPSFAIPSCCLIVDFSHIFLTQPQWQRVACLTCPLTQLKASWKIYISSHPLSPTGTWTGTGIGNATEAYQWIHCYFSSRWGTQQKTVKSTYHRINDIINSIIVKGAFHWHWTGLVICWGNICVRMKNHWKVSLVCTQET